MKYIMLIPDGMFDLPVKELDNKTPLEVAHTPWMDKLALKGSVGRIHTIPKGFLPASDVANLNLIGYDPCKYYTGRGPLEAANLGIHLEDSDVVFRMNFVTIYENKMIDYSAGHIKDEEAKLLIEELNKKLGTQKIEFFAGKSYRNIMVIREGKNLGLQKLKTTPPHDIIGKKITKYLPQGKNNKIILDIMQRSQEILEKHDINNIRIDLGENPANMVWLWGQGTKPHLPSFKERFSIEGGIISAVDLIKGIGKIIGLEVIEVEGATGYYDTNYQGKARAALKVLQDKDFVFLHLESIDEAGHNQHLREKILAIERFDKFIVGGIVENLKQDFRIAICPDHYTPLSLRTHTNWPVGFIIYGKDIAQDFIKEFNEKNVKDSSLFIDKGYKLIEYLIKGEI